MGKGRLGGGEGSVVPMGRLFPPPPPQTSGCPRPPPQSATRGWGTVLGTVLGGHRCHTPTRAPPPKQELVFASENLGGRRGGGGDTTHGGHTHQGWDPPQARCAPPRATPNLQRGWGGPDPRLGSPPEGGCGAESPFNWGAGGAQCPGVLLGGGGGHCRMGPSPKGGEGRIGVPL